MNQLIKNEDLYINIKKTSSIKIRELDIKERNVCEYIIILIYIFSYNNEKIILIHREIHIVDDLFIEALIKINIMKSKIIVFDIARDMTIIESYSI